MAWMPIDALGEGTSVVMMLPGKSLLPAVDVMLWRVFPLGG